MKTEKNTWFVIVLTILSLCLAINTSAVGATSQVGFLTLWTFDFSVPEQSGSRGNQEISLRPGETMVMKGSFSPFLASVKYGLFDSKNGIFYGVAAQDGILDYTVTVAKGGTYYFTVINNSSVPVSVSGYINY